MTMACPAPLPLLTVALSLVALSAAAQSPKPYAPVVIARAAAHADESFAAFRARLAAVAKRRLYADLAPLIRAHGFFWDRDFDRAFDPRKPAVDNFAAAIALEHDNGRGWRKLAAFAAELAAEPLPSRPGVICVPAQPVYDSVAFSKLLETTYTSSADWAYPRADDTSVRIAAQPDAAIIGKLELAFIRLLRLEGSGGASALSPAQWARVVLPNAKIGFAAPGALISLSPDRLCYLKDLVAGWQIAGYVAGGN